MISIRALRAHAGNFALGPISFELPQSAHLAIVGPSGHGKSTLLWSLSGALPSEGSLRVKDVELNSLPPERRALALVPQGGLLFPHLSVAGNIAFANDARTRELAEAWGISNLLERNARNLSGGEAMRVALARDPQLLLLDEPFAAVDEAARAPLLEKLRALRGTRTIIHVTHELDEAASLATHLGVLRDGKLVAFGATDDVLLRPPSLEVAQFLGVENVLAGTFELHGEDASLFTSGAATLNVLARARGAGFVSIPERAVIISLEPPREASARNTLAGTIASITADRFGARVELQGDVRIASRMERESVAALGLTIGQRAFAIVKAAQIRVLAAAQRD